MKRKLTKTLFAIAVSGAACAQTILTGPSSSQSSYLQPLVANSTITSIFTASNAVGAYTMAGLPDGTGAFDNGDGTFTLLMNHEMGNTGGAVHAHGSTGAFISKWIINKSTLAVVSGADLIQNVNLWTGTTYTTYNSVNSSTLAAFARFCSADLPAKTAFYNSETGKGTQERIFLNGEENGNEGRALAHIATGTAAGNTYELPYLGKASFENQVACPFPSDKTIVVGLDDTTPGQVYVYIGTKNASGNDIVKAGLSGGKLYGVAVLGLLNESSTSFPAANTMFNLIDLGSVQNMTGATLNTNSNNVGVTNFLRPEDGAWDPANPSDFYFVTTNSFTSPSRLWRLRFTDIRNPELGGTITAVLDGTEGQKMLDNLTIDHYGFVMLQEDVGNNAHNGKIWQYKIANDALSLFAQHDTTRFISGAANFLTQDEESSGMIDAQEIFGAGMFLLVDQAHYAVPSPVVEGGQLLRLYNPNSANANPEINVQGNAITIANGNTVTSNTDNTNFGTANLGNNTVMPFVIQNAGPGVLSVKSISIGGVNAGDFTIVQPSPFPATIAVNATQTLNIRFTPGLTGTRSAMIYINNNDFDESSYAYRVQGVGVVPEIDLSGNNTIIPDNNIQVSTNDNTDFGSVIYNTAITKSFVIQNSGTGTLTISGINIANNSAAAFSILNASQFPMNLSSNMSTTITVQFMPTTVGNASATLSIMSNDADEATYDFVLAGKGLLDVGVKENTLNDGVVLYPNPTNNSSVLQISSLVSEKIKIVVSDLKGMETLSLDANLVEGDNNIQLNTSDFIAGEYLVVIKSKSLSKTVKLIVIH